MLGELDAAKKTVAGYEGGQMALFSGLCVLLRGVPLTDDKGAIIRPLNLTVDGNSITKPDGDPVNEVEISMALKLADRDKVKVLSPAVEHPFHNFP